MKLASDKIPNKLLTGPELLECAVLEFRSMLERDCMFSKSIAYRRVAFTLLGTFHLGQPFTTPHVVKSRVQEEGVIEGEVPLTPAPEEEESEVLALERDVNLDNPNVARITHGLPIKVQERMPPTQVAASGLPGEPPPPVNQFPNIVTHELHYDKTQAPAGIPPVDRDVSDKQAEKLGIKRRNK